MIKYLLLIILIVLLIASPAECIKYKQLIKKHALRNGFNWKLIAAQIYAESNFDYQAVSPVGAIGLMQIMPGTSEWLGTNPDTLVKPEVNISLGCYYDRWLINRFEDIDLYYTRINLMLSSYNWGIGNVKRTYKKDIINLFLRLPDETFNYIFRIHKQHINYEE